MIAYHDTEFDRNRPHIARKSGMKKSPAQMGALKIEMLASMFTSKTL